MTEHAKLPRALSREPSVPKPLRPSHQKIIVNLDRWADSREFQPPNCRTAIAIERPASARILFSRRRD